MSPQPTITTTPHLLPRQSYDPYDYSSLLAELSSLYPDIYASNTKTYNTADYSSLMAYYSSLLNTYDYPTTTTAGAGRLTTTTRRTSATTGAPRASNTAVPNSTGNTDSGAQGLSTAAKIGIGIGAAAVVFLLAAAGVTLWCCVKRRQKKKASTIVTHPVTATQQQQLQHHQPPPPQMSYVNANSPDVKNNTPQAYFSSPINPSPSPHIPSPPPQYGHVLQQPSGPGTDMSAKYAYNKPLHDPNVQIAELEHEYHSVKPGVVELGDGIREVEEEPKKGWKLLGKKK